MSPSSSCFSFETSLTTSPLSTVELLHLGSCRVEDTTYLGRLFSRSAHAPLLASHRAANHSSLRRPSSRASVPSASSNSTLAHSSRSWPPNWPNQPPSLKPSCPSGSWTTPSNETFVLITIFPILVLLLVGVVTHTAAGGVGRESPCAGARRPRARPGRSSAAARRRGRARSACVRAGRWRRRRCGQDRLG